MNNHGLLHVFTLFSLRGGVAISSFIVGSIKQAKHAVGMQQKGARGRSLAAYRGASQVNNFKLHGV